jgi:hypothetical protein
MTGLFSALILFRRAARSIRATRITISAPSGILRQPAALEGEAEVAQGLIAEGGMRCSSHGDYLTPCSQSQIERDCHLQRQRTAQVKTGMALSVVVRWRPVRAVVNGTLVARPARTTFTAWQRRHQLGRRVRPVRGDKGLVGKPLQTARQLAGPRPVQGPTRPAARTTEPFEVPAPCRSILRRWKLGDLAHIS